MRAALGSLLLALGIVLVGPAPLALAHADLVLSTPEDGARLATVPDEVELAFSEDLIPESVVVSVEDSVGLVVRVLELEVAGADVIVAWPPGLTGPDYAVNYRVVSQDGHPVSGSLTFAVDTPSAPTSPSATSPSDASSVVAAPTDSEATTTDEASNATAIAAIAAGLGVGIAVGFLYLMSRRRGRASESPSTEPGSGS